MIKEKSRWKGVDGITFVVLKLEDSTQGMWVFYKNEKTDQEYHCLLDAFLDRFSIIL